MHNHVETKHGLMAIIKSDMELYLGFQAPNEACDDYIAVFKARVDTINGHEGLTSKYPWHLNEMFLQIMEEQGLTKENIKSMSPKERGVLHAGVQEIACEEYIAILFIKQANKIRYGELKPPW